MIYLIGGPGRAGKTTLATSLCKLHHVPYFSTDYLMMGLHKAIPSLGINPNDGENIVAEKLWPVCKPMIVAMLENGENYCIEGFAIRPKDMCELSNLFPTEIKSCILGYGDSTPHQKLEQDRKYGSPNPWLDDLEEVDALHILKDSIKTSLALEKESLDLDCKYFDTSHNFEKSIANARNYLVED